MRLNTVAVALAKRRKFAAAMPVLDKALVGALLEFEPDALAMVHGERASVLSALKQHDVALSAAGHATDQAPDDWLMWDTKGRAMSRAGSHAEAVECFQRALDLRPPNVNAESGVYHNLQTAMDQKFVRQGDKQGTVHFESKYRSAAFFEHERSVLADQEQSARDMASAFNETLELREREAELLAEAAAARGEEVESEGSSAVGGERKVTPLLQQDPAWRSAYWDTVLGI